MAVKPMTQQRQWECFGFDRAFACNRETGRVIPFESTLNGWNLAIELEAPNDANSKLQEVMDIMITKKRTEQTEKMPHANKQIDVDWTTEGTSFWVARHRPVRPIERSLEPLTQTDGDDAMMDNPRDDDAGETNPTNEAIGSRDCHERSMWSLSVSRLVPRLCWKHWAVRRSQTTE